MATWTTIKPINLTKPCKDDYYKTLYELAVSIYEQYKTINNLPDLDEDHIQTDAIPALVYYLFDGLYDVITPEKKPIWDYFVKEFISRFLNRMTCNSKPEVFRSKLIYPITMYKDFIENADGLWDEINTALSELNSSSTTDYTNETLGEGVKTNLTTNSATNDMSSEQNSTVDNTTSVDNTLTHNTTVTDSGTDTGTVVTDNDSTTNESRTGRNLVSDYPQSNVSASTIGNPALQTWTYASGQTDENTSGTSSSTNDTTQTNNLAHSSTNATTGTEKNETSSTSNSTANSTNSQTSSQNSEGNSTTNYNDKKDDTSKTVNNSKHEVDTPIDLTLKRIKFWEEHPLRCVSELLRHLEQYFISCYVDEERDGFIDWSCYNNLTKYID